MSESKPSLVPGSARKGPSAGTRSNSPGVPRDEPPVAAGRAKAGCGCEGSASVGPAAGPAPALATASMTAPSLRPGVGAGTVAATWQNNVRITGLWSINEDRNCWAHLENVGWRNLSGSSESGLVALNMLAAHAFQQQAATYCYEDDAGRISQIYVW